MNIRKDLLSLLLFIDFKKEERLDNIYWYFNEPCNGLIRVGNVL